MKKRIVAIATCVGLACACGSTYVSYGSRYLPDASINGMDVSNMTFIDAKDALEKQYLKEHQKLTLMTRDGKKLSVPLTAINLSVNADTSYAEAINLAVRSDMRGVDEEAKFNISFDEEKLASIVETVLKDSGAFLVAPENAHIEKTDEGFSVVPETEGTELKDTKEICRRVIEAVGTGLNSIQLDDSFYKKAVVTERSGGIVDRIRKLDLMEGTKLSLDIRGSVELIDWGRIRDWVDLSGNIDEAAVRAFVDELAERTDTYNSERAFQLRGKEFTVKGPYGFTIDREGTTAQLVQNIKDGVVEVVEPVYSQTAATENQELGNVFVEVDVAEQHVFLYENGEIIADAPCVTGNTSLGRGTPSGIFPVTFKTRNATLRGPGYASFVNFWMPFNGGIGLHDAPWRGSFGGSIYRNSGSHGCVNLPYSFAKTVYEHIEKGFAVVVHT